MHANIVRLAGEKDPRLMMNEYEVSSRFILNLKIESSVVKADVLIKSQNC